MKSHRFLFALLLLAAFGFSACDVVDEPLDPNREVVITGKKVLIEDFTGHQCGNCPRAHETIETLKGVYGKDLVVIALHVGGFARVSPAQGYPTDFKTPMGDVLEDYYDADNFGLPVGMVNRRAFNGEVKQRHGSWGGQVATLLSEAPVLDIELEANYDMATKIGSVTASLEYFQAGNPDHHIVAVLTEDSIFSKQSDYSLQPPYVPVYCQKHVLRKSITSGTWGEQIKAAEIFVGESFSRNFSFTLDSSWKPEQMHVVVYVMDNSTKEILQVEETHL